MKKFYKIPSVIKIEIEAGDIMAASVNVVDEGDDNSVLTASWLG